MLAALAFTTLMMVTKRSLWGRAQLMALITLAAFACVLYIGFDAVYERIATLRALDRAEGGRWQIVQDIARAWTRFQQDQPEPRGAQQHGVLLRS